MAVSYYYYSYLFGTSGVVQQWRYLELSRSCSWTDLTRSAGCLYLYVINFVQRNLLPSAWPESAAKWVSSGSFLWSRRIWWARQMPVAEWSKEKGCLACKNSCFTVPWNPVSFLKTFLEKPLGERVAPSWEVTWEQFPVCFCCQLSSRKVLLRTQRRLWTSSVSNNLSSYHLF